MRDERPEYQARYPDNIVFIGQSQFWTATDALCDACGEVKPIVLVADSSDAEYPAITVCTDCLSAALALGT